MAQNVGQIEYDVRLNTASLAGDAARVEATTNKLGKQVGDDIEAGTQRASEAFDSFKRAAGAATIAAGVGLVAGITTAVKSAGTFESSLSQLRQASSATSDEMANMSKLARALGQDNSLAGVTAQDAAYSMTELSKAGLSVKDTMDATRGVMSLAKAGNMDFAEAAIIAASALNAFGMEGSEATKVADMLAAGANASQADLADLALGMQQSATVAKQFKLGLQENVTALALFANNGIRGSDAGTSLKTMLIALAKPSKEAATAMKDIGFEAYNAEGQFVGLREMSIRLQKSMNGLTDEQKQATLATIFGTDAFRAAAILAENAGDSYDSMSSSVGKVGAAQDAAKAQMGAFNTAVEGLSNQFSELSLQVGSYFLPAATQVTNTIAGGLIPAFNTVVAILTNQIPLVTAVGLTFLTYTAITTGVTLATGAWTVAVGMLNAALAANPLVLVTALVVGLTTAYIGVTQQSDSTKSATDRLNAARDQERLAADAARVSEDRLRDAQYSVEGSALAVERAQRNYTKAVEQYGPQSLEAREAEFQLKRARDDNAKATETLKTQTDKAREANQELARAKDAVVKANNEIAGSAGGAAKNYWNAADAATSFRKAQEQGNKGMDEAVKKTFNAPFNIPGRASGGSVSANMPYFVGENRDGSLNSTSELFVPRTSGTIMNSADLRRVIENANGSSDGGNVTLNLSLSGVMTSSPEEERVIARRILQRLNEEMRAHGRPEIGATL